MIDSEEDDTGDQIILDDDEEEMIVDRVAGAVVDDDEETMIDDIEDEGLSDYEAAQRIKTKKRKAEVDLEVSRQRRSCSSSQSKTPTSASSKRQSVETGSHAPAGSIERGLSNMGSQGSGIMFFLLRLLDTSKLEAMLDKQSSAIKQMMVAQAKEMKLAREEQAKAREEQGAINAALLGFLQKNSKRYILKITTLTGLLKTSVMIDDIFIASGPVKTR
jgi:hypothetical protein